MTSTLTIPKEEYDDLVEKARLFEKYVETEDLSKEELERIKNSAKGPFMTKAKFLELNPELK